MAKYLESINDSRKIIVCDSFVGVPFDNKSYDRKFIVADSSKKLIVEKLKKFNVFDRVEIVEGYFENTLKTIDSRFSFAFLDSDTYESGKDAIPFLCERTDGIIAIHDYIQGLPIKNAVDEHISKLGLEINKNSLAYIKMVRYVG